MRLVRSRSDKPQEVVFGLIRTFPDCVWNVMWEGWLQNNIVVQVVFEVFSTLAPTMAVVNAEYLQFRPFVRLYSRLLLRWLDDIEND